MNNGRGRFDRKVIAVFVVLLMLASNPIIIMEGSEESYAALPSNTFTYTITPDGNIVGNYTAIAGDAAESGAYTSNNGTNVGSWGFDSKGYGPFGSFYAAFDPTQNNKMICHLDPNDLTKSVDGVSISGKGYNIMWCLPTVYWSTDSSGNLILSNDPSKGTAFAHTIDGKVYKYIGIGVYEASTMSVNSKTILTSTSGDIPLVSQTKATFRDYANNQSVNTAGTGNNGYAMVWNFYQWELYKYCALAVMGSWDSQGVAGNGSSYGGRPYYDTPGLLNTSGPYAGTRGSVTNTTYTQDPVKVFIENAWGSLFDFVDGVVIMNKSLVVDSKSIPTDATVAGTNVVVYSSILPGSSGYGSDPSTEAGVWGMPTATNGASNSGLYDYVYSDTGSNYFLCVGGFSGSSSSIAPRSGLSYPGAANDLSTSSANMGGRLAFVFDADPASTPTVTLDHSNLTAEGGDATGLRTSIDITDGAKYPDLNVECADSAAIVAGWTHTGWEVDGVQYAIGETITITQTHTAKSLWAAPRNVVFDHSALSDIGGNTDGLPSKAKIDDLTDGYPDLNTYTGNSSIQDGYVHVGWHVDGKFYAIGTPVLHDTTHTAYSAWVVPQILITFMVEGEVHSTLSVPKGSVGVVYTPVMVEGVFEGWYYDPEYTDKYDSSRPLDGPTTLYAKGVPQLVFTSVPTADATIAPVDYKGLFFFDATGSSGRYQVHWDFGDGNTSDEPIAYNTYTEPGRYTVKLTVTNIYGEQAESEYVVDLRDGTATDNMKWFAVGALCVIAAGLVIRRFI